MAEGPKVGDILEASAGPLTMRMEVVSMDQATLEGELRITEIVPRIFKPHKPENNGFGLCIHCGRGVHRIRAGRKPPNGWMSEPNGPLRHNPIPQLKVIPDRERTHCSKCGSPGESYTFKPGSGECNACAT